MAKSGKGIQWAPKKIKVTDIKVNPNNPKILNQLGLDRLKESLATFGMAGTVIVNTDNMLIDGHSRLKEAIGRGEKFIWASMPDRKLTTKEYKQMNAVYDMATASDVDEKLLAEAFGGDRKVFEKFSMQIPKALMEQLGAKAEKFVYPDDSQDEVRQEADVNQRLIFLTNEQAKRFDDWEENHMALFKAKNLTDFIFNAVKFAVEIKTKKK